MAYRALRRLTVGETVKEPGDLIPEAMEWTNTRVWLSEGFIEEVPDEQPAPKSEPTRKPAATRKAAPKTTKKE